MQAQAKGVVSNPSHRASTECTHDVHSAGLSVSAIPVALTRSVPARLKASIRVRTVEQPLHLFFTDARLPVLMILIYPLAVRTRVV